MNDLDQEKLRAEIDRDLQQAETLMRQRLNWESQEQFWRAQQRTWQWQTWLLFGTFVLGVLGIISRVLWP